MSDPTPMSPTPPAVDAPPPAPLTTQEQPDVAPATKPKARRTPQKARAKSPATRARKKADVTPEDVATGLDINALIEQAVNDKLVALGVARPPDPEPTELPEEQGFRAVLWLAGNASVTRQLTIYLEGSRNPIKFRDGFCVFRGERGEREYKYVLNKYPDEVFVPNWDEDVMGPWPQCYECGWMVPNFRAHQAHIRLHQKLVFEG